MELDSTLGQITVALFPHLEVSKLLNKSASKTLDYTEISRRNIGSTHTSNTQNKQTTTLSWTSFKTIIL